jgi:acyl carrier protein
MAGCERLAASTDDRLSSGEVVVTPLDGKGDANPAQEVSDGAPGVEQVQDWLIAYVAALIEFEPSEVRADVPLSRYGLDSLTAPAMMEDLSRWLGKKVEPTILYKLKTIDDVAAYVVENIASLSPLPP